MCAALSIIAAALAACSQLVSSGEVYPAPDGTATESDMDTAVARIHSNMMRAMAARGGGWAPAVQLRLEKLGAVRPDHACN